jgi:ElaB/YqjD/DUF883 family membrane-anchored ribosome-binding protein
VPLEPTTLVLASTVTLRPATTLAEVGEMTAELKQAMLGAGAGAGSIADEARAEAESVLDDGANVADEIDAISRAGRRSARESEAEQKLAELKRRMGK